MCNWNLLTKREWEVVELVGEGMTNNEISDELGISCRTVHSHVDHIFNKMGLNSRLELTIEYFKRSSQIRDSTIVDRDGK